jgi:hypothetical protein
VTDLKDEIHATTIAQLVESGFNQRGPAEFKAANCQVEITVRNDGWEIAIHSNGTVRCRTPHLAVWQPIEGIPERGQPRDLDAARPQELTESQISERLDWMVDTINGRIAPLTWRLLGIEGMIEGNNAGLDHYNERLCELLALIRQLCEALDSKPQPPAPVLPFPTKPSAKPRKSKRAKRR